jgi:CRISPR-associated endonuclease/helicase Cas3
MSICFKSFDEIKAQHYRNSFLKNSDVYLAHSHKTKASEKFYQHNDLVVNYFLTLVMHHRLDEIVDNLISTLFGKHIDGDAGEFIKLLFFNAIAYHDYGKVNENFQIKKMNNSSSFSKSKKNGIDSQHSILSAYIFIVHHFSFASKYNFSNDQKHLINGLVFLFAYPILKHHSSFLKEGRQDIDFDVEIQEYLKEYLTLFDFDEFDNFDYKPAYRNNEGQKLKDKNIFSLLIRIQDNSFPLFTLIKLNFSLLTAADYLATHEYMNSDDNYLAKTEDFGVFKNRERLEAIIKHLQGYKHNAITYADLETHQIKFPTERSNDNLNFLRKQMAIEVVRQIRQNTDARLFYLEAPTGGGKTNLAALIIAELLAANEKLNKAFLVFPFTTLITQTFGSLKTSMDLLDDEIVELHSKAAFASKEEENKEKTEDGFFGDEKKDFIDNLFALYPITLMSHVKFFDILKTSRKETNYLLHRMANSIVVIDELQSYNPAIWDKMLYFIDQYAYHFNIRFILMSATLPKISDLKVGFKEPPSFLELLPNAHQYIANINFSGRVRFNFELYNQGKIDLETLSVSVMEKSKEYLGKNGSVKTIVEFIYKKSASVFQRLFEEGDFFDKIFVLSGTILESRRKEIINYIKRTATEKINILLITTQVVEAGVDIDMDMGFKNVSLLDSDEQLAGRVNRNATKEICEVYLFDVDDAQVLYGKDHRYKRTKEMSNEESRDILKKKDFKKLYEKVMFSIDADNKPIFQNSINTYKAFINNLRYSDVDREFKIIDQDNNSIFVPLYIPIQVEGTNNGNPDKIFTDNDLKFLEQLNVFPEKHKFDEAYCEGINGAKVWDAYKKQIDRQAKNRKENSGFDIKQKIHFKTLQSIMTKFCFSLISHSKDYREMQNGFGHEEYGYFYFSYFDEEREKGKPYNYKTGLNSDVFSDSNFI